MSPIFSPYTLCREAERIIAEYQNMTMPIDREHQVICLLNKAESFHEMSAYQLSMTRKRLADYYLSQGITGSALDQFKIALSENPRLSVKKKVHSLESIPREDLIYSIDANIADEPNYDEIHIEIDYVPIPQVGPSPEEIDQKIADAFGMTVDEMHRVHLEARRELAEAAEEENAIYDPEFEEYVEKILTVLGEPYRKSFYENRLKRKGESVLSNKEHDILSLRSMAKSFAYHNKEAAKVLPADLFEDN